MTTTSANSSLAASIADCADVPAHTTSLAFIFCGSPGVRALTFARLAIEAIRRASDIELFVHEPRILASGDLYDVQTRLFLL